MPWFAFSIITDLTRNTQQLLFLTTPIFITIIFVVNPFRKLFYLWLFQPPQFQFLSDVSFPPDLLFEHHIHQQKKMLTHYLFTWDYFHIFDTTSLLVIHKNVIKHCLSFTWSKCYKMTFPFLEASIHQVQPFTAPEIKQQQEIKHQK